MIKEKIKDIADNLELGMRCFVHSNSKEIKFIPDYDRYPEMDPELFAEDREEVESNPEDYIEITGMRSRDSFTVMADFTDTVDDELKEKLIQALNRPKPFRSFKFVIDNSGPYREKWFSFKESRLIDWVERQLQRNQL